MLNKEQKDEIAAWAGFMEKDMQAILRSYNVIKAIDQHAANYALNTVIQKYQKTLDKNLALEDLNDNWNKGLIDKGYYERTLIYIEKQYA